MTSKPIIEFQKVSFTYLERGQSKIILKDFTFQVYPRDKIVIYGKSGSGKTTLFYLLLGFKQPQKGRILVNGQHLGCHNIWKLRQLFAYVDQDTILGQGRVKNIIREYLSLKANRKIKIKNNELLVWLKKFNLPTEILQKTTDEISGGERQRLAIILALILDRPIILLDEATSSLDPANKKIVLQQILSQKDKTIISVTHDSLWLKQPEVKIFNFLEKRWQQR